MVALTGQAQPDAALPSVFEAGLCSKFMSQLSSTPEQDAQHNWRKGDRRLRAIRGYVTLVPGIENASKDDARSIAELGYWAIEGTSDAVIGKNCFHFNAAAERYAIAYNRMILKLAGIDIESR